MSSFATDYSFVKRFAEGVVGLTSSHGQQMFVRSKLRKPKACALCNVELKTKEQAYRPITNGYNRMHRLCVACVLELEQHVQLL